MSRQLPTVVDGTTMTITGSPPNRKLTAVPTPTQVVSTVTGPATVTAAVGTLIPVNVSGGAVTIHLPASSDAGAQIIVKLISAASNACVINSGTIDGASSLSLNANYEWAVLVSTGSAWLQIG